MNERTRELAIQAGGVWRGGYVEQANGDSVYTDKKFVSGGDMDVEQFAESMIAEFSDVVKTTANELAEHYYRQGCSEEEVMMRVNGALVVLGHIRARFKD